MPIGPGFQLCNSMHLALIIAHPHRRISGATRGGLPDGGAAFGRARIVGYNGARRPPKETMPMQPMDNLLREFRPLAECPDPDDYSGSLCYDVGGYVLGDPLDTMLRLLSVDYLASAWE